MLLKIVNSLKHVWTLWCALRIFSDTENIIAKDGHGPQQELTRWSSTKLKQDRYECSSSLGQAPSICETESALRKMANGEVMGLGKLPAETLKLSLDGENPINLHWFSTSFSAYAGGGRYLNITRRTLPKRCDTKRRERNVATTEVFSLCHLPVRWSPRLLLIA